MPLQPVLYRIKVRPDVIEERTDGGIIIPEAVKQMEQQATMTGTVVAIGPSSFEGKPVIKEGERILFAKYGGMTFRENGEVFRYLNDEDIIAVER